jgi:single-strand selective monofunctional uracil DNA glycosylase
MGMERELIIAAARELCREVNALEFADPVAYTYNPLDYAWEGHEAYIRKFGAGQKEVLYLGMNPGPFGMAQTGVPFGEIAAVTLWMGITASVGQPPQMHPKRPVQGFSCPRSEVSGRRLWGLFEEMYGTAEAFFRQAYVANYCPLIWMSESGANITPTQLPKSQVAALDAACQRHLVRLIEILQPRVLIGVGGYALKQLELAAAALPDREFRLGTILHPSPASPVANKYWPERPREQIREILNA